MLTGPISLIAERDFRRLWIAGACGNTVRWLEILAIGVFVFESTGSAFLVALMTMLRALPVLLFGTLVGTLAARVDRKRLFAGGMAITALVSATLAGLAWSGQIALWQIALGAFAHGVVWSTEHTVRRTMLGETAGLERLGSAMGLDSATANATRVVGPLAGGILYEIIGLDGAYTLSTGLVLVGLAMAVGVRHHQGERPPRSERVLATLLEGLRYVRGERAILAVLLITAIVNLFGFPYLAMVAVVGREVLQLSAFPIGFLMASQAFGALLGSLLIAALVRPRHYSGLFLFGSILFVASVEIFAWSGQFAASLLVLFVGGFGAAGFGSMQSTLVLASAPAEMRSRAMGWLAVAIGFGPLGMLHVGLLADWLGVGPALAIMAGEGLVALALVAVFRSRPGVAGIGGRPKNPGP